MTDLLTTAEAAAELGVSQQRVRALIAAGRLPAVKLGQIHAIRAEGLEAVRNRPGAGRPRNNPNLKREAAPAAGKEG